MAYFTARPLRAEKVATCIVELDTLKFLISVAWEANYITHKQYEAIALKLTEVGKMFGGWKKSLASPDKKNRTL